MTLSPGARLGPYEIVSALGSGGMGEVYGARDLRLGRDVAIKVLPERFAADPERIARFEREAKTLAALNHPNIATIHGLEDATPSPGTGQPAVRALVMELVEGPTLADRIAQGPLPLDEALPIAKQIAEALEAAHEQGIIHRDLKPANIKLKVRGAPPPRTQDGHLERSLSVADIAGCTVKVLDFGLAKLAMSDGSGAGVPAGLSQSPTITSPAMMTGAGMILGTAAYMSPEQARGKVVDKRSDIWAFGCVLYEMLTGKRAFAGEEMSDVLASVLAREPDLGLLPPDTPSSIRRLVRRCLQKDRKERLHDISDARIEIQDVQANADPQVSVVPVPPLTRHTSGRLAWISATVFCLVFVAALTFGAFRYIQGPVNDSLAYRTSILTPPDIRFTSTPAQTLALSPDGRLLGFVAAGPSGQSLLWIRRHDSLTAQAFPGTEGASAPFWSPDSQFVAFLAQGQLRKIDVSGGPPLAVCDLPSTGLPAERGTETARSCFRCKDRSIECPLREVRQPPSQRSTPRGGKPGISFPSSCPMTGISST